MGKKANAEHNKEDADVVEDVAEVVDEAEVGGEDEADEQSEIDTLREQVVELRDTLIRKQADFENTRKRLRREMEEAGSRALVRFVRPFLTEMDNFELAINSANPEAFQEFAMGVTMIKSNIDNLLSGAGIEKIPAEGVFDPKVHEVILEREEDGADKGTILDVTRTGYKLGDTVVRASQVVVAAAAADDADAEEQAETTDG